MEHSLVQIMSQQKQYQFLWAYIQIKVDYFINYYQFFYNSHYNWLILYPCHQDNLQQHHHLQTYMKKEKFDFFASPNPRAFDISKIQQNNPFERDDQQMLFNTPAVNHTFQSPLNIDPYFSHSHKRKNRKNSEDCIFEEEDPIDQNQKSSQGINQKLEFSEEEQDCMISVTPRKDQKKIVDQLEDETLKKEQKPLENVSVQWSINEVGLKNLALEAYKYISNISKAFSYKEIAYGLMNKLNGNDNEKVTIGKNKLKNKATNIKRRVYDVLNVFIAVGLLEKNGKRVKNRPFRNTALQDNKQYLENSAQRSEKLQVELKRLEAAHWKKSQTITRKQQIYHLHLSGVKKLRYLQERNKSVAKVHQNNIINFPFLSFVKCEKDNPLKQQANPQKVVTITQENESHLQTRFQIGQAVDFIGDFDIINSLFHQEMGQEDIHPVNYKNEKSGKRRISLI